MFSKSKKFLVAILLASSAAAAPPRHVDSVHAVIDAIKAQLKAQNVPHADHIVDKSVAHLKDVGFLDDGMISDFNAEIAVSKQLCASFLNSNQSPLKTCPF